MKTTKSFILMSGVVLLSALISNKIYAENFKIDVDNFTEISISVPAKLIYTKGPVNLQIEASESDMDHIKCEVKGETLDIYNPDKFGHRFDDVTIYVSSPSIESFSQAGSGEIICPEKISGDKLKLSSAGSGNMDLKDAGFNKIEASLAGSGNLMIAGKSLDGELSVSIAGSGNLKAEGYQISKANLSIAGSGNCYVYAEKRVEASIVGSGSVYYKGNPILDISSIGSGKAKPL